MWIDAVIGRGWLRNICHALLAPLLVGCALFYRHLPPVNLQERGWTVKQGQAVWRLSPGHDIAGDVLIATAPGNKSLVQFTKTPFPFLIGRSEGSHWQVELPVEKKFYAGQGAPPKRLMWLYLPRALMGMPLPQGWTWKETEGNWRLQNHKTGETIEGFFSQ